MPELELGKQLRLLQQSKATWKLHSCCRKLELTKMLQSQQGNPSWSQMIKVGASGCAEDRRRDGS